jgi:Na+/H+-dicarboxylate symporter
MDRCRTVMNVTGDCVVTGIVSYRFPIDEITGDLATPSKVTGGDNDNSSATEEKDTTNQS